MTMSNPASGVGKSRAVSTTTWVRYPITYEPWAWTATCKSLQFGKTNATDATKSPKMNTPAPKCELDKTNKQQLTIHVTDVKDNLAATTAVPWGQFVFKMEMSVKNPSNHIESSPVIGAFIENPTTKERLAVMAAKAFTGLKVKPALASTGTTAVLVSFGVDPSLAAQ